MLRGDPASGTLGLRDVTNKFNSGNGYRLNRLEDLTPSQKRAITQEYHRLQMLTAQPRRVYKPKGKGAREKLEKAKMVLQHDIGRDWKIALIPGVPKFTKRGKEVAPRLRFGKESVTVVEDGFARIQVRFDAVKLATGGRRYIKRVLADEAPKATRFRVQADENEIPGPADDREGVINQVLNLMHRYDGVSPLPKDSGNRRDRPEHHKWDKWLKGVVAYQFPRTTQKAVASAVVPFDDARRDLQRQRKNKRKAMAKAKKRR